MPDFSYQSPGNHNFNPVQGPVPLGPHVGGDTPTPFINMAAAPYNVRSGDNITVKIAQAIASSAATNGATIWLPPGDFFVDILSGVGIDINLSRVQIWGCGKTATRIRFLAHADGDIGCRIWNGGNDIARCGLRNIALLCSDTTYRKTALQVIGSTEGYFGDVELGGAEQWHDGAYTTISLHLLGHELNVFDRLTAWGDRPVVISKNPYGLSFDQFTFRDWYLAANQNPCVEIDSDVIWQKPNWEGYHVYIGGTGGVRYRNNEVPTAASFGGVIRNINWEQPQSDGYIVEFTRANDIHVGLVLENLSCGSLLTQRGIKLYHCFAATINNFIFTGSGAESLNIDAGSVALNNVWEVDGGAQPRNMHALALDPASASPFTEYWS